MHEAYAHPQLIANGMVVEVEDPELGATTQIGVPVTLSRNPGRITGPRPRPGQHNEEVLGPVELGSMGASPGRPVRTRRCSPAERSDRRPVTPSRESSCWTSASTWQVRSGR